MAGAQVQELYAGIAGEHVQAMTSKGIVAVSARRDHQVRRRTRQRGGPRAGHSAGARTAACHPAGVHGRQEHGDPRSHRHERHAARDGDVPRDHRQLAGDQPAQESWSGRATRCATSSSSRWPAHLPCSPRTRRSWGWRWSRWAPARPTSRCSTRGRSAISGTIPFGGNNVTSDIVHGLGVTQADAERLKERYGCAYEPLVDPPGHDPAAEYGGPGRPADSARAAGAHHPPADGRDLRPRAARHRRGGIRRPAERGHRAHRRRGGACRARASWPPRCSAPACAWDPSARTSADSRTRSKRRGSPQWSASLSSARTRMALGATTSAKRLSVSGAGMEKWVAKLKFWLQDFF